TAKFHIVPSSFSSLPMKPGHCPMFRNCSNRAGDPLPTLSVGMKGENLSPFCPQLPRFRCLQERDSGQPRLSVVAPLNLGLVGLISKTATTDSAVAENRAQEGKSRINSRRTAFAPVY